MRRIAGSDARFLSRGDGSGTHEREQQLWARAGMTPPEDRLVVAGAGMGSTLRAASETGAYTLTDRATFGQLRDVRTNTKKRTPPMLQHAFRAAAAIRSHWICRGLTPMTRITSGAGNAAGRGAGLRPALG